MSSLRHKMVSLYISKYYLISISPRFPVSCPSMYSSVLASCSDSKHSKFLKTIHVGITGYKVMYPVIVNSITRSCTTMFNSISAKKNLLANSCTNQWIQGNLQVGHHMLISTNPHLSFCMH